VIAAIVTVAERPNLIEAMWEMPSPWPPFMLEDPVAGMFWAQLPVAFPEYQLLALDADDTIIAKVHSVPFAWSGSDDDLSDRGLDAILERAFHDLEHDRQPTAASLVEARVAPDHRGQGLSYRLLEAARGNAVRLGFDDLFGPVRPSAKSKEPRTPIGEYVMRVRPDGLPSDPWLRAHVRLGARIVKVCPMSMIVPGTLAQWRDWTGLALRTSGSIEVDGALVPVHVSVEHDHAVYVEANVWLHHRLEVAHTSA
jgi:GNAT superfamily N-acetyltransferase